MAQTTSIEREVKRRMDALANSQKPKRMKLSKFIETINTLNKPYLSKDPDIEFVGMKWQDQHHPSAELFPIEFVAATFGGGDKVILKFITTKHNK